MNEFKESLKIENYRDNIQTEQLTDREARRTYEKFVLDQEEQFILFINYLNRYINDLRDKGIITPHLAFYARVKATNSAFKNHTEHKALDDVFGIEILGTSEPELMALRKVIESSEDKIRLLHVGKTRVHDKENGYKAEHHYCIMEQKLTDILNSIAGRTRKNKINSQNFPLIEFQYKTFEVYYQGNFGTASHEKYKGTQIKQVQALYDAGNLTVGEYIPIMWVSNPYDDNVRELSAREVIKKMYPTLELKEIKKSTSKEK